MSISKGKNVFFHSFIPPVLRENQNRAELVRARALMTIMIITTLMLTVGTLIIIGHHLFFDPGLLINDLVSVSLVLLFGIQVALFWRFGNLWLSGTVFTLTYFMLFAGMVIVTGGAESPMLSTLLTYPVMAYLIGGREEGFQGALVTFLFVLGLTALSAIDFDLPNLIVNDNTRLIFSMNWVMALVIISFCIVAYENELRAQYGQPKTQRRVKQNGMSSLSDPFDNFVRGLVPEQLRDIAGKKTETGARSLILAIMLIMASASSLLSAVILIGAHLIFYPDQLKYDWIIVGITLCFAWQTWVFYKFKNLMLSSYLLSYSYFLIILTLVVISGGYDARTLILLQLSPVIFFMLGGIMNGIQNAVFVAIVGVILAFSKQIDIQFINVFHAVSPTMIFGISWAIVVLAIGVCMIAYDEALQELE